jgi:enoyl-CoA hydratase/carnithine racemase
MTAAQSTDLIEIERDGAVATLWLNRPDRLNALNHALIDAACAVLDEWQRDLTVRCVVLRGRGRAFCAGDDLKGMSGADAEYWEQMDYTLRRESGFEALFKRLYWLRKPVIAALHGHAVGAGAMIALACDIRIVTDDVSFGFPFVKRGITGATTLVARYTNMGKAHEMLLTGNPARGPEAVQCGLANVSVPPADFDAEVARWAQMLASGATRAQGIAKYALHHGLYQNIDTALALNSFAGLMAGDTQDRTEGITAFREKRQPQFTGR